MDIILFLIAFPLLTAILLLVFPWNGFRKVAVWAASAVLCAGTIYFFIHNFGAKPTFFVYEQEWISKAMIIIEALVTLYILVISIMKKKWLTALLVVAQFGLIGYFEITFGAKAIAERSIFFDQFSIIMALIIGIIGSLICVYAVGYMKDFHHHHKEMKDRRPFFFFILFVFLSAMFGIVFSNNLMWLLFFWEITTLCSFLLIGYTKTEEAVNNAFLAITMNLLGGLAFAGAIVFLFQTGNNVIELDKLLALKSGVVMIPVALICFAGITKAAQLPFSKWLLGAMVAPTPTSALLHSSTMVKAGVYIIIRMSPLLFNTPVGYAVALIGAITFLVGSFIAISQRNAKKVLAYSTIANLGLIVACAGVGTYQTIWAGVFLIIFHAVAKSLLFLSVGTVEHRLGSRDIEHMDNLVVKMPRIALMMTIGICGMFIAPFGMLISKWAAMEAFVNINPFLSPVLILLLCYGSAVTLFFWTKWLGKIIAVNHLVQPNETLEKQVSNDEWLSVGVHAALTVAVCLLFPFLSSWLVDPYIQTIFGKSATMASGNFILMAAMVGTIIVIPIVLIPLQNKKRFVFGTAYMAGRNADADLKFEGSMSVRKDLTLKNYYLENIFGENKLINAGIFLCTVICVIMIGVAFL